MKIGVIGCAGRMGRTIIGNLRIFPEMTLAAGLETPDSSLVGEDLGILTEGAKKLGIKISSNLKDVVAASDALIDFSAPEATLKCADACAQAGKIHIIGTTGLSDKDKETLAKYAKKTVIVQSGNMSIGVNLLLGMVEKISAILPKEQFDIEVLEMHHRNKVDAPSGTALMLGEAAAKGRNAKLDKVSVMSREGHTGARKTGDIGFATLRGGGVVGDHSVIFVSDSERIEVTHKAQDRSLFAVGALTAARWAKTQKPGRLYSMKDVLGL